MKKVFISHSSKDSKVVELFAEVILCSGLGVKAEDIFASSIDGHKVIVGNNWRDEIKQNIQNAKVVFAIVTPNYKKSEICQNELGATWILSNRIIPLYISPITPSCVGPLLSSLQVEQIDNEKSIDRIREIIKNELNLADGEIPADKWDEKKQEFLSRFSSLNLDFSDTIYSREKNVLIDRFLESTYQEFEGFISKESRYYVSDNGNCIISQDWSIMPKHNITHLYHEIHIDKPGVIKIESITDVLNKQQLDYYIVGKSDTSLRYYILFNGLRDGNSSFTMNIRINADNYLSDVVDKKNGIVFNRNIRNRRLKFMSKKEVYYFPNTITFENLKAEIISHPDSNQIGNIITSYADIDKRVIVLTFEDDNGYNCEYGAKITI